MMLVQCTSCDKILGQKFIGYKEEYGCSPEHNPCGDCDACVYNNLATVPQPCMMWDACKECPVFEEEYKEFIYYE